MLSSHAGIVVVAGYRGFVGGSVCRALRALGTPIVGADRQRPVEDIGEDVLARTRTLVWLVSSIRPGSDELERRGDSDLRAFERCLEALARHNVSPRILLASSGGTVYDETCDPPFTESSPVAPATPYARAKLRLEERFSASSFSGSILRIANPYGPGQSTSNAQGVVAHWLHAAAEGRELLMIGDASTVRDFLFVDDLAGAIARAALTDSTLPAVLNVGSGSPVSLGELADEVRNVVAPKPVVFRHQPARPFDRPSAWLDVSLAASSLGWVPHVGLAEGLRRTWMSLRP